MSIRCINRVWEHSNVGGSGLLVLLAIADHANDDGGGAWPSIETLAGKCKLSKRQVQRIIQILEEEGELSVERGASRARTNVYTVLSGLIKSSPSRVCYMCSCPEDGEINVSEYQRQDGSPIALCDSCHNKLDAIIEGDKMSPSDTHRVTSGADEGDIAMSPDPSLSVPDPSCYPSPQETGDEAPASKSISSVLRSTLTPNESIEEDIDRKRHKWETPDNKEQEDFLNVCGAKWFESRQKRKVKAILTAMRAGDAAGNSVYGTLSEYLDNREDLVDVPPLLPRSWYEFKSEHAKRNRWSRWGFINALLDRDALMRHCQIKMKNLGVPVQGETTHTPQPTYEPELEYDEEEVMVWAESFQSVEKTTVWSKDVGKENP